RTEIPLDELMQLLGSLVKERVNAKIAERLARQTPPFVPLRIVKPDGEEKLSLRKITRSLEGLGLSLKQSSATARQVLLILRTQGFEQVPRTMLTHLVAATLEASYGRAM